MMMTGKPFNPGRQRGVSLIVTLLIVVLLSLLGLYGAGVLVLDIRSAANDYRAREAMAAAESGTEQGLSILNANRKRIITGGLDFNNDGDVNDATDRPWASCADTMAWCLPVRSDDRTNWQYVNVTTLVSQPTAGTFDLYMLTPKPDAADPAKVNGSRLVYNLVAIGRSADTTSTATLKQGAYYYPLLLGHVNTPLAAASNVPLNGNYSIVTNSDRDNNGSNVPVSAWSNGSITPSGSFATCHIGDFSDSLNGCPLTSALSKQGQVGEDLVTDPAFPTDLFEFLFGAPAAEYQKIKDDAEVVADCNGLGPTSKGLIWVTGNCNLPNRDVGSEETPVLLVVEGAVTSNGSYDFYGLIYLFNLISTTANVQFNGDFHIHGALFVHNTMSLNLTGNFVLEYDREVLDNLDSGPSGRALARIPGAWSDVTQ